MPIIQSIKSFFAQSVRVWYILRKPTRKEFERVTKISAIGIIAIGAIGFLISIIVNLFFVS